MNNTCLKFKARILENNVFHSFDTQYILSSTKKFNSIHFVLIIYTSFFYAVTIFILSKRENGQSEQVKKGLTLLTSIKFSCFWEFKVICLRSEEKLRNEIQQ